MYLYQRLLYIASVSSATSRLTESNSTGTIQQGIRRHKSMAQLFPKGIRQKRRSNPIRRFQRGGDLRPCRQFDRLLNRYEYSSMHHCQACQAKIILRGSRTPEHLDHMLSTIMFIGDFSMCRKVFVFSLLRHDLPTFLL